MLLIWGSLLIDVSPQYSLTSAAFNITTRVFVNILFEKSNRQSHFSNVCFWIKKNTQSSSIDVV